LAAVVGFVLYALGVPLMTALLVAVRAGTPLQNDTKELWSLLNFMEPTAFPSKEEFLAQFGDLKQASQVQCVCVTG
jgi:chromodomain-helicase-DNA-binding protein 6